jgi:hypothetical protein
MIVRLRSSRHRAFRCVVIRFARQFWRSCAIGRKTPCQIARKSSLRPCGLVSARFRAVCLLQPRVRIVGGGELWRHYSRAWRYNAGALGHLLSLGVGKKGGMGSWTRVHGSVRDPRWAVTGGGRRAGRADLESGVTWWCPEVSSGFRPTIDPARTDPDAARWSLLIPVDNHAVTAAAAVRGLN